MIENKDKKLNLWMRIFFVIYVIAMLYFLFFADAMGRMSSDTMVGYNTKLFKEIHRYLINWRQIGFSIAFLNIGGNIIGFLPLGFLLPFVNAKNRTFFRTLFICIYVTMTVEVIQLIFHVGCFDVDDMFLNTVGGICGYVIFMIGSMLRRKKHGKEEATRI
ncbi:MAG: VanZ family protein [Lachnospiraceae bacterium]|nr:VanZ family protein [Lachnospiraceae bacterium]